MDPPTANGPTQKRGGKGEKTLEKNKNDKINLKKKRKKGTFLTNPPSKEFV